MQRSVDKPTKTVSAGISAIWPGRPYPLGATWDGEGVNFALFSEHAERVELCLFDADGRREMQRIALRERTDQVWHCYLPEARPGHALRLPRARALPARGGPPLQPAQAAARSVRAATSSAQLRWSDALFGYTRRPQARATSRSTAATAPRGMPKCLVIDPAFTWGDDRAPGRAVARHGDLRAARARLHDAAPGRAASAARHLRRAGHARR